MSFIEMLAPFVYPLFLATILFSLYAQIKVSSSYRKCSGIYTARGLTGADVARMILRANGINNVEIVRVAGSLTDHYNPKTNTLALSDGVISSASAAAIGVAAHEAGHAVQYNVGYFPVKLRSFLVPITSFASRASWIIILLGAVFAGFSLMGEVGYLILLIGVMLFAVTTLFQLVTLPCEFNASRRAMRALRDSGFYSGKELSAARSVLSAAALTYVAATLASLVQLLRLVIILLGRRNNRR